jgi:3-dehydroquinate dehydratase
MTATAVMAGLGAQGYALAVTALERLIAANRR